MNDPKILKEDFIAKEIEEISNQEAESEAVADTGILDAESTPEEVVVDGESEAVAATEVSDAEGVPEEVIADNETEADENDISVATKAYHEDYYLLYEGEEGINLDLEGTYALLKKLGFNGGELRQARKGKADFEMYKPAEEESETQMFCSYCGAEISGIEYERLPDGRLRCTSCNKTLVKSEMQELCNRVKENMEAFFGIAINVPIHIEVLEERKLKKKIRCSISDIDNKSLLVLGAAVNEKKKGYRIYLENGAPRISVIATFAHELTHIWQYINWDNKKGFPKCPKKRRLLIYEGMAKWVEIQYLYLIGEAATARREEYVTRKRDDEYGNGFRLYEDKYPLSYGTVICNNAPFTVVGYPIS